MTKQKVLINILQYVFTNCYTSDVLLEREMAHTHVQRRKSSPSVNVWKVFNVIFFFSNEKGDVKPLNKMRR